MKTIIRFFSMLALVGGIAVTGALAQDVCSDLDTPTAQYEKFLGLYNKKPFNVTEAEDAVNTGKAFLEKFGACEAWKEQTAFVTAQVKRLSEVVDRAKFAVNFEQFDAAVNADNTDGIFTAGKTILAKFPENHNIKYVMAVSVNREISKKNNKFNADAITYAKSLLDGINSGAIKFDRKNKAGQETIGVLKYEVTRPDAVSELNYTLGNVLYFGQNDKKGAIPYFYQTTQTAGFRKEFAPIYATIGAFYVDEAAPIGQQIAELITKQKAAATDEEKLKLDEEIKAKVALFNGYTERALDAYGRAWTYAKADTPAGKTYKDGLLAIVKDLYKRRTDKDTGAEQWVSTSIAKPLPDPTSAVQPVTDPEPTNTTTTTTGAGVAGGTANADAAKTAAAAKPKP